MAETGVLESPNATTGEKRSERPRADEPRGFGTFKGVFVPSILTIFGVIMYLRMGWVVGNVGLAGALLIVTIASALTFLTGLSISVTATNTKVGAGGAYYMVSRAFGVEAGAAIGLPLFFAQSLGVSFYVAGFAETVHGLFPMLPPTGIGVATLVTLTVMAYLSADLALKAQVFIFAVIFASLVSFFAGGVMNPPLAAIGPSVGDIGATAPFWVVFAVFFPAVTGIEAGISLSGDLKDPARSLPWGTMAAVLTGYVVYMAIPIVLYHAASPEVLRTESMVIQKISWIGELILLGIFGATLSSALGALLGAPRTLQALAKDHVLPGFLGQGSGPNDEPRVATAVSFMVALGGILLGDLNAIAPVLSMFFLTSYGALNLTAALEGIIGNPSWRPTFRTPWALSLLGAAGCVSAMLMINAGATYIAGLLCFAVYYLMQRRNLQTRWTDMRRGILLFLARFAIYRLDDHPKDPRSWRPNLLVLSGSPTARWHLVQLADAISHGKGFLTFASVVPRSSVTIDRLIGMEKSIREFLAKRDVPALVHVTAADNVVSGVETLIRSYGVGALSPNTVVLGRTEKEESFVDFARLIQTAYRAGKNLMILREAPGSPQAEPREDTEKRIELWWGGHRQNASLSLVFAYMLSTSPEWRGAGMWVKSLVRSEEERAGALEHLHEFLDNARVQAGIEVLVKAEDEDPILAIGRYSRQANLVFMGMRPPEPEESPEDYATYYGSLIERTEENFPPTAFVLVAEKIEFQRILH